MITLTSFLFRPDLYLSCSGRSILGWLWRILWTTWANVLSIFSARI